MKTRANIKYSVNACRLEDAFPTEDLWLKFQKISNIQFLSLQQLVQFHTKMNM